MNQIVNWENDTPKPRNDTPELRNCIKLSELGYNCPKPEPRQCEKDNVHKENEKDNVHK